MESNLLRLLRRSLVVLAVASLTGSARPAPAQPAPVPPPLAAELERLYASWKSAMASRDLAAWSRTTARARQMMVRNTIVSQKREWPRALFSLAMAPPEIRGLRLVGTQQLGAQARLVYHGRIDFELDDPRRPPDAVLVLDFVSEPAGWRFFASRYFNFRDYPAESAAVARGDLGFLNVPPLALTGEAPPVPRPCPVPDYSAQIRVASFGYTTRVSLGDFHRDVVSGRATTEVVHGGLRRGLTPLVLEVEPLAEVPPEERSLEVVVYALTPTLKTKSSAVLVHQPNNPVAPRQELSVLVGPSTLQQGNEGRLIPSGQ
ncbi:MAG: hypothetical protein ACKV19_03195 [Verrucomicrobiales bacterium]